MTQQTAPQAGRHASADARASPPRSSTARFYAFTLDRLVAWTLDAVAAVAAYRLLLSPTTWRPGSS